jgi:RNA polymerase sigma-70 factor (ECF subfamily)
MNAAKELIADKELVRRGDAEAFQVLFDRYYRRVYGVAKHIVADQDAAMDVAQQAFIRAYKYLSSFDPSRSFYTWLYQITVNLSIDAIRRKRRTAALDEELPTDEGPERAARRAEIKERVRQCLDKLPVHYKATLVLREIEGLSCEETAEILQCTNATVRWRIHHARKLFKAIWTGSGEEI